MKSILLFLLFLFCAANMNAQTLVASCVDNGGLHNCSGGNSINTTGATAYVAAVLSYGNPNPSAPSGTPTVTWSGQTGYGGTFGIKLFVACGPPTSATHTFTVGGSDTVFVMAFSGTASTSCVDSGSDVGCNVGSDCTGGTGRNVGSAVTPGQVNNVFVTVLSTNNTDADSVAATGYTITDQYWASTSQMDGAMGYRVYNSTSPLQTVWDYTILGFGGAVIAIKPAPAGPPPVHFDYTVGHHE